MSEQAFKLLEARISEVAERMRSLAAERDALAAKLGRLETELTARSSEPNTRSIAARQALRLAAAELRED